MIKAYIINLKSSQVRRKYMEQLLSPYTWLQLEFIDAIDGRKMPEDEVLEQFDYSLCIRHNGRELNRGEIGCVLSHRKAYESLLKSESHYALVLEDDVSVMRDLNGLKQYDLRGILATPEPTVLFLSGDYWFLRNRESVVTCFDALGAYAYIINRSAAELMLNIEKPYYVADDWTLFREMGLSLKAIKPYMIDANLNMDVLSSDVQQLQWGINRKQMSLFELMKSLKNSAVRKFLKFCGMFESKHRVINGKVVTRKQK